LMCTEVKDFYNSVTLGTADLTCLASSTMFDEANISASNTYTSINSVTHVWFSYWTSWVIMTALSYVTWIMMLTVKMLGWR